MYRESGNRFREKDWRKAKSLQRAEIRNAPRPIFAVRSTAFKKVEPARGRGRLLNPVVGDGEGGDSTGYS